jgi:hypothetical protein
MPTSTRRQAASRNQRYSEVSVGALSSLHDEDAGQHEVHEDDEEEVDFEDEATIDDGEMENEAFGANGTCDDTQLKAFTPD